MNECGRAIQLCKAGKNVCKGVILACEIMRDLLCPVVYELKESFFVGF
jgi:hypothetical protein